MIVDILTSDMRQLHGANRVTEKLIKGYEIFKNNGIDLRFVVSQDGIIDCSKYNESILGSNLDKVSYRTNRKIVETLKKLPIYKSKYIQRKILFKQIEKNNTVVERMNGIEKKADFLIYQDPFTAIVYLNKTKDCTPSIFISHAAQDPLEQLLMNRSSLVGTNTEKQLREMYEELFRTVNSVVTICSSSQQYMKKEYGIDSPCILNGIEDVFQDHTVKNSCSDGKVHIVIVASVQYRKGQDIAVKAISKLNEQERRRLVLHIIGGGNGLDSIKEMINEYNLTESVILHGPQLHVEDYLNKMDVFLLPSRADTVPISVIEAMRASLPVWASNVGEIPNMIRGCGYVFEPTENNIVTIFRDLINNKYDLTRLGSLAREKYEQEFTLETMIKHYVDVIKNTEKR